MASLLFLQLTVTVTLAEYEDAARTLGLSWLAPSGQTCEVYGYRITLMGTASGTARRAHFSLAIIPVTV